MNYRRVFLPGSTYFFTLVTYQRRPIFSNPTTVDMLRNAFHYTMKRLPFTIGASVIMPDHLHSIWALPPRQQRLFHSLALDQIPIQPKMAPGGKPERKFIPSAKRRKRCLAKAFLGTPHPRRSGSDPSCGLYPLQSCPPRIRGITHRLAIFQFFALCEGWHLSPRLGWKWKKLGRTSQNGIKKGVGEGYYSPQPNAHPFTCDLFSQILFNQKL
jgi:hypothetical protein